MVTFKYNKYHQFTVIAIEKGTQEEKYKNREMQNAKCETNCRILAPNYSLIKCCFVHKSTLFIFPLPRIEI